MDYAEIKKTARRAVHSALAVACLYDPLDGSQPIMLTARLHTRMSAGSDGGGAYSTVIEGVTRAVFNREELTALGVTLVRNAKVTFPDYTGPGGAAIYVLDIRDAYDGPITEKWSLATA